MPKAMDLAQLALLTLVLCLAPIARASADTNGFFDIAVGLAQQQALNVSPATPCKPGSAPDYTDGKCVKCEEDFYSADGAACLPCPVDANTDGKTGRATCRCRSGFLATKNRGVVEACRFNVQRRGYESVTYTEPVSTVYTTITRPSTTRTRAVSTIETTITDIESTTVITYATLVPYTTITTTLPLIGRTKETLESVVITSTTSTGVISQVLRRDAIPTPAPAPKERKRQVGQMAIPELVPLPEKDACAAGMTACAIGYRGAFECVDLAHELENCGSCGNQCGAITGVKGVSCIAGKCEIGSCRKGFTLVTGDGGEASCMKQKKPKVRRQSGTI